MSFEQTLRGRISKAPFRSKEKNILKVVLGDIQQKSVTGEISDERGYNLVKSMIKNNTDKVLAVLKPDDPRRGDYEEENKVLASLLPKYLSADEVEVILKTDELAEQIKTAKSEGQATGVAMKHFKATDANVEGDVVKAVVKKLRV